MYTLDISAKEGRQKLREQFYRNAHRNDPRIMDLLVMKVTIINCYSDQLFGYLHWTVSLMLSLMDAINTSVYSKHAHVLSFRVYWYGFILLLYSQKFGE